MRVHHWIVLVLLAALTTGCIGWADAGERPGSVTGQARVVIGGVSFPVYEAKVAASGATNAVAWTQRDGAYRLTFLRKGQHDLHLQALHGTYRQSLYVQGRERRDWVLQPGNVNAERFFELAALKRVWLDAKNQLQAAYDGELVRWEKRKIAVYMDVYGAPYGFDAATADRYWQELRRWEQYLAHQYEFVKAGDPQRADIVVQWVEPWEIGDQAGITRQVAHYYNGALKLVEIYISVDWADSPGVWEHELGRAMGLGAVSDQNSVMYPRLMLSGPQRRTLSQYEASLVRLMYDIPSGQRLGGGWRPAAVSVAGGLEDGDGALDGADLFGLSDGLTVAAGQLLDVDLDAGAAGALPLVPAREAPVSGARESVLRVEPGMTPDMMPDVTLDVLPHRAP